MGSASPTDYTLGRNIVFLRGEGGGAYPEEVRDLAAGAPIDAIAGRIFEAAGEELDCRGEGWSWVMRTIARRPVPPVTCGWTIRAR